jgi:putative exosortase-associated protein (TIGR04073 family)
MTNQKIKKRGVWIIILLVFIIGTSFTFSYSGVEADQNTGSAASQAMSKSPKASAAKKEGPLTKLGRGFTNLILFPLEVPKYTVKEAVAAKPDYLASIYGVCYGAPEGVGWSLARFASGLVDVLTFPAKHPEKEWGPLIPIDRFTFEDTRENVFKEER